jgi:hypothetical protein
MPVPSCHVELALYADDSAISATSRKSALLIRYLESYLSDLQGWLREWRIAINVLMRNAIPFAKAAGRVPRLRPINLLGHHIEFVN